MFDLIKKFIRNSNDNGQITDQDALDTPLALTVLLLEAAHADGECSDEEKKHLVTTLVAHFGISRQQVDALIADRDRDDGAYVDLFHYTRFMNDTFSEKQKIDLMESVWRILLLDDLLEAHEDHFAHKLATLLRLSHSQLIDAKLRARKQLSRTGYPAGDESDPKKIL